MKSSILRAGIAVALIGTPATLYFFWAREKEAAVVGGQWGQPGIVRRGPLNPRGLPQITACRSIPLADPIAEARANIARGDRRPFTVYGFTPGDVPGIFCPSGKYQLESRGGTFVSDMPDACGGMSFSNAPRDKMLAYNRALAADPKFQQITQCQPSTYCEEKYRKGYGDASRRDPQCPAEPQVLVRVAQAGTTATLSDALKDFRGKDAKSRDVVTAAFVASLEKAKWDNAEALLRAGADINGRARDASSGKQWLGSPLEAVFNQNNDLRNKMTRARWLFDNGLTFVNPGAHQALTWAASSNDTEGVNFLLAKGASPNGSLGKVEQDELARGNIQSAGGGYGYGMTPFYQAIGQAGNRWARRTPEEIAHADAEQHKGRVNAVTLYKAGGRFFVGKVYDGLRQQPDIKIASILIAAAHREGRASDLIDRILFPNGTDAPFNAGATREERALLAYIQAVKACGKLQPVVRQDDVKLCRTGNI
jgi:hypothetical protein